MRWLFGGLVVLVLLLAAAVAGVGWLVGTESGLHWAASKVPDLQVTGLRGRLAGEITADKLAYEGAEARIDAEKISLRAHLAALMGGRLTIDPLRVTSLAVEFRPGEGKKADAKPDLPLRLHVANAQIDSIEIRRGTARYVVRELKLDHARLGRDLSASGSLYWPDERFATRAKVDLRGTLERIDGHVVADVSGVPAEGRATLTQNRLQAIEVLAGPIDLARFEGPNSSISMTVRGDLTAGGALAGTIALENALPGPIDAERLPFTRLDARFLTDFASARLEGMRVALPGGATVQGEATIEQENVKAKLVAAAVNLRTIHTRLRQTALHGPLEVRVEGERQWARGSLTQEGIGLTVELVRSGETVEVQELRALVEGGEVSGTGKMTLGGAKPFTAKIDIKQFDPAAIGDYPAGSLTGAVLASGRLEPRSIELKWSLRESVLYEHTFATEGAARLEGTRVTGADASLRLGANRLTARGAYGRAGDELVVALEAPRLEEFTALAGSLRARGTVSGSLENPRVALSGEAPALELPGGVQLEKVAAKLAGTLAAHDAEIAALAPELALDFDARLRGAWTLARGWVGQVVSLKNTGAYPLELLSPAPLRLAVGRVELGRVEARLAEGRLVLHNAAWSPSRLASSGEFSRLPAQWGVIAAGLGERLNATLLVDGEWELVKTKEVQGFVRAQRATGDVALLGEREFALGLESAALEARFDGGRASGRLEARSALARVRMQGELMPALALEGKAEFAELGALTRPFLQEARLDGRFSAELRASGTLDAPRLHGTLVGEALAFELPAYGVAFKEGTLKAILEGDRLRLESLAARGGEGSLSADGTLSFSEARIAWRAETLSILDRPDMRLVASGEGEVAYDGKRASLTGELRADRGHFEFVRDKLPKLSDDVVIVGNSRIVRAPVRGKMKLPLALDLRLDLGDEVVFIGYGYDGKLAGLVDLATTKDGELRAFGRVQAVHATFLAYGQRLDVDPGVLIFDGPIDNPSLQITAWRRNQAVEAGVQLTGTLRAPSVNLVSQPPVPEGERLSWLVLGRPPSGATQADLGLLQAAAGALLASGESVPLDRRIARRFGLDEITLRGTGEMTDRFLAVGKRLSDRLYISYEQGLGAVATNLLKLDYALGRRWTLRAEAGTASGVPSSGGGLFYRYSWD
jgi:translocation and assembly module TamB